MNTAAATANTALANPAPATVAAAISALAAAAKQTIMMAVVAPGLIGVVGLGVETGYWYHLQAEAQMAADVSAYAGAVTLRNGETATIAKAVAKEEAAELGFSSATKSCGFESRPSGNHW